MSRKLFAVEKSAVINVGTHARIFPYWVDFSHPYPLAHAIKKPRKRT